MVFAGFSAELLMSDTLRHCTSGCLVRLFCPSPCTCHTVQSQCNLQCVLMCLKLQVLMVEWCLTLPFTIVLSRRGIITLVQKLVGYSGLCCRDLLRTRHNMYGQLAGWNTLCPAKPCPGKSCAARSLHMFCRLNVYRDCL